MTEIQPAPRAVAIGLPDRIRTEMLVQLPDVLAVDSLSQAAAILADNPRAVVMYGEITFGAVVSGQPVFVLEDQGDPMVRWSNQVMVVVDVDPRKCADLVWDDPRRLASHAGIRLKAARIVDVSADGIWPRLSDELNKLVAEPPAQGVPSGDGNDEPNGDPDDRDQPPAAEDQ